VREEVEESTSVRNQAGKASGELRRFAAHSWGGLRAI